MLRLLQQQPWWITLVLAHTASAGEQKPIELSEVPEAIRAIVQDKLPDIRLVSANTETELDGGYLYEIQGLLPDGRKVEFDIYPDHRIQEIEIEFTHDMVPGAVFEAIKRKLPGFEPDFVEASHSRSLKVVRYEFVGKLGDKELDIDVSADGRTIEVADR